MLSYMRFVSLFMQKLVKLSIDHSYTMNGLQIKVALAIICKSISIYFMIATTS